MDRQKYLMKYINRAKRSLNAEKMLPLLQYGVFLSLVFTLAILFVSRFFVFAYYDEIALAVACATIVATAVYMWWKRVRTKEALRRLDDFYPFNELVTALSFKENEHPLADSIMDKAVKESEKAFERFKRRTKQYWRPKALFGILIVSIITAALWIFPSETQQEAQVVEKEQEVIRDIKKEVAKLERKAESEDVKKELKELLGRLKEAETPEQALREVVKKQKELKLQEQKLQEKRLAENADGSGLTEGELQKLKDLAEVQSSLAQHALSTQKAISKLGAPLSFELQNTIGKMMEDAQTGSKNGSTSNHQTGNSNTNQGNNNQQNNGQQGQGSTGSGNNQGQGNTGSNNQGQGSTGSGNNQGQWNTGSGTGQGQGSGSGTGGQGSGSGSSAGGGAGKGSGGRTLLSIPSERLGERRPPTVDGGPLGQGNPAGEQKGQVPVTKGTVRSYEEVIGAYEERYMQSAKRMQLPRDLQNVVESYFSSLQSEQ
ncbi:hypothetical protein NST62_14085 [Ureibacillus sp. FSL K6-8385]|uniref:DUF4175 domain-containing protein n=1 Tax=Ureibacillus terrenus TaxID=118246 RepID=A0A540UYW6_9BACL|nr:hypothetical protein [Ureibacillus terrenus]TQE89213.1 hypothetical protein FKZ59_12790 [Ureibacillus terrenus]